MVALKIGELYATLELRNQLTGPLGKAAAGIKVQASGIHAAMIAAGIAATRMGSSMVSVVKIFQGDFKGALTIMKDAVGNFGKTITGAFKKLWELGKDLVIGIKNGFVNAWNGFISSVSCLMGEESKIKETASKLTDAVVGAFKSGKISEGVKDSLVEAVKADNDKLFALAKQREQIGKTLADAMAYVTQVSDQVRDWASLSSLNLGSGDGQKPLTAENIQAGLQAKLARVRLFASVIKKLAKRGLSKSIMAQVIEAGPDGGVELGQALLEADAATFKSINSTAGAIDKAAKQAGKNAADAMFDAGKNAGKGFLTGLISQKKQIEAAMKDIATSLVNQIKKQLKQKSPSRVFMDIGANAMTGLRLGMVGSAAAVMKSARGIAGQLTGSFAPELRSTGYQATGSQTGGQVTVNVTNHFPQAEPTSRTVNRGLQYAAVLGLA
ncbi:hypothetical protein [Nonomuraea basaltis]|uniref:hypothetical protein n=1 Tax=Nonomuraea basaltis TaxID=2495887 RepID=UPI00110C64FF|nr:hypothetical protein [Nonomuraea basaltis]TMR97531.1 hypothetical protein EJK15_17580 [Nonomuraea basaltis]